MERPDFLNGKKIRNYIKLIKGLIITSHEETIFKMLKFYIS